ncbi:MAG: 6-bladed beta-propeller [Bacteroidales bacterium]|jgi:hypothetical protein|nr:6-bladed beta-propeller [Bacteroidales bacterium]
MRRITVLFFILFIYGCGSNSAKESNSGIPVIDISKKYPEKTLYIQDIADVEYVLPETADVMLDASAEAVYVSDKRIVAINRLFGDVFIFSRDGKMLSRFNPGDQGRDEYIIQTVYDEKYKELYIYSISGFSVFSENGERLRTFQTGDSMNPDLYNFDDETLLAYDKFGTEQNGSKKYRTKPYLFLSKKDGSIVSVLDRTLPVRYSNRMVTTIKGWNGEKQEATMAISVEGNNWHDGKDFVIADFSSDTVFRMTRDKILYPLIIRKPTVHNRKSAKTFFTPLLKTDKFMLFSKNVIDFDKMQKRKTDPVVNLLYYFTTGEIYDISIANRDCPLTVRFGNSHTGVDIDKNMAASLIASQQIIDCLERGEVKGNLLPAAQKLTDRSNPVLMIMKFK